LRTEKNIEKVEKEKEDKKVDGSMVRQRLIPKEGVIDTVFVTKRQKRAWHF
jgi:hypothetical protein